MTDEQLYDRVRELINYMGDVMIDEIKTASPQQKQQYKDQISDPKQVEAFKKHIAKDFAGLGNRAGKPLSDI